MFTGTATLASERIVLVRDQFTRDPQGLPSRVTEWQGIREALEALAVTLNCPTHLEAVKGTLFSLVATRQGGAAIAGGNPSDVVYADKWTLATDTLEQPIFAHPFVFAAAVAYDSAYPTKFKKQAEDFAEGTDPDASITTNIFQSETALAAPYESFTVRDVAFKVVIELGRGGTHYENEYRVMRRARSIGTSFPTPMPVFTTGLVYSSIQLGLPVDVLFSVPTFPTNPIQAQWGWRLRQQQSDFMQPGRIEQTFEWVLAAWSTLTYSAATENFPA